MLKITLNKILPNANKKAINTYIKIIKKINNQENKISLLSNEELKKKFKNLKYSDKTENDIIIELFPIIKEASSRVLKMKHFDVQLMGGIGLIEGKISEMKTGEGKTLVSTLASLFYYIKGKQTHIVTTNSYLSKRDFQTLKPLFDFFEVSSGCIEECNSLEEEIQNYQADIVFGTNNKFVFDYLNDNMIMDPSFRKQQEHSFVIIDEIDSILIDEARTPLIISAPAEQDFSKFYEQASSIIHKLQENIHFTIDIEHKNVSLTEEGIFMIEDIYNIENLFNKENEFLSHIISQTLRANFIYNIDVDYVVDNGEVFIVDEFTGRIDKSRRFGEGLHQAIEAKENLKIKPENITLSEITYQNYFKLYDTISGMSGTAKNDAQEFLEIYNLEVVEIPTNKEIKRIDYPDLIFKTEKEKLDFILMKIKKINKIGQPILIGTSSVEKSEQLHNILSEQGLEHSVLNAKNHKEEANIIKNAGLKNSITIATNMAGRGVDIKISKEVNELGGLFVIGSERHDNRRIDDQLRGRSGRQGDNGSSLFCLSLEDSLLKYFGSSKLFKITDKLGLKEGDFIESSLISNAIEKAQKKVENLHYEKRKELVEYDDIYNHQRKIIFNFRNSILNRNGLVLEKFEEYQLLYIQKLLEDCNIIENSLFNEDYDIGKLKLILKEVFFVEFKNEDLSNKDYSDLLFFLNRLLFDMFKQKMQHIKFEIRMQIEKEVFLSVIDDLWRKHLYHLDMLKEGVKLRVYNQKDPLIEFKKESFVDFEELLTNIKLSVIFNLHKISNELFIKYVNKK